LKEGDNVLHLNYSLAEPEEDLYPYTLIIPKYIRVIGGLDKKQTVLFASARVASPLGDNVTIDFKGGVIWKSEEGFIFYDFIIDPGQGGHNLAAPDCPCEYRQTIFPGIWEYRPFIDPFHK